MWHNGTVLAIAQVALVMAALHSNSHAARATGPLRVCRENPRYFADGSGRVVYLTGSHTWADLVERAYEDTAPFDFDQFLDFLEAHGHNFIRLWAWEHTAWMQFTDRMIRYWPHPWRRTGPGKALDGRPRFDLTKFNERFFRRMRSRVQAAGKRGIYVAVMLFQGFSIEQKGTKGVDPKKGNPWNGHPFNIHNNINGINGDLNSNGEGEEVHTLANRRITRIQEAYVRKVVQTLNDLDNVLYEIANESHGGSTEWQYHMIRFIRRLEATMPKQHPVGMTFQWDSNRPGSNGNLFRSPAEWISPNPSGGYRTDPPAADGRKVVILDTDHLWGHGGDPKTMTDWVWKSFLRGHNPIFMDPYKDARTGHRLEKKFDPIRRAMGQTLALARKIHLEAMTPRPGLASSKHCLADPGGEYLVYLPRGGSVVVDLSAVGGKCRAEWFEPATGRTHPGGEKPGGARRRFKAPFEGPAVLRIVGVGGKAR